MKKLFGLLSLVIVLLFSSMMVSAAEPVEIEVMETTWGAPIPPEEDDFIQQALEEAVGGIDIKYTSVGSTEDYERQINVRLASGNFPDLFQVFSRTLLAQYVENGILLDLSQYEDKLQPVKEFVGEKPWNMGKINGKLYAINKPDNPNYASYWIRKDWLDNLGLKVPTTLDEMLEVAKAFTFDDPDGNGKQDTFGLTADGGINGFSGIFGGYELPLPGFVFVKDGKVTNSLYEPKMVEALKEVKKFIDAGVVDPELLVNTGNQWHDKVIQGKAGMVWAGWPRMKKVQFAEQMEAVNPEVDWIQIETPAGPYGRYCGQTTPNVNMRGVPATLAKEPEKLNKLFDMLNYISDKDGGNRLVCYGIEGRHYNVVDGGIVPTELLSKEAVYGWVYQFTGRHGMEYLMTKFGHLADYIEFAAKRPQIYVFNNVVDKPEGYVPADADRYIDEEIMKFIYGKKSFDKYEEFLNTLDKVYNYNLFMDNARLTAKKLGLVE